MFFLERANGPKVHNAALPSSSKQIAFCTRGLWAQNSWQDKLLAFNLTKLVWSLMQQIMSGPIFQKKWTLSRVFTCQTQVTAVQGISCKWVTIGPIKLTKKTKDIHRLRQQHKPMSGWMGWNSLQGHLGWVGTPNFGVTKNWILCMFCNKPAIRGKNFGTTWTCILSGTRFC